MKCCICQKQTKSLYFDKGQHFCYTCHKDFLEKKVVYLKLINKSKLSDFKAIPENTELILNTNNDKDLTTLINDLKERYGFEVVKGAE